MGATAGGSRRIIYKHRRHFGSIFGSRSIGNTLDPKTECVRAGGPSPTQWGGEPGLAPSTVEGQAAQRRPDPGRTRVIHTVDSVGGTEGAERNQEVEFNNDVFHRDLLLKHRTAWLNSCSVEAVSGVAGLPRAVRLQRRQTTTPTGATPKRNAAKRGLRSQEAVLRRNRDRSIKRNIGRRGARKERRNAPGATAQEPSGTQAREEQCVKMNKERYLTVATINVRGEREGVGKYEVERWMAKSKTDISVIQESHVGENKQEIGEKYTWVFGGVGEKKSIHEGVAVVFRNEMRNYVQKVIHINERIIAVKMRGVVPITIIGVYAPTAMASWEKKQEFYKTLKLETKKAKNNGATFVMGDFNARLQCRLADSEECIGPYTF